MNQSRDSDKFKPLLNTFQDETYYGKILKFGIDSLTKNKTNLYCQKWSCFKEDVSESKRNSDFRPSLGN